VIARPSHCIVALAAALCLCVTTLLSALLAEPQARGENRPVANAVVAADGTGDYRTVQDAINAVPQNTSASNRWIIFIKAGTYRELIYVQREKRFVTLVGEDPARAVLTYNLNANMIGVDGKPIGTFRTPSTVIDADDFTAENLTFENSAGPVGQALALRVDGDRVVFRNCRFLGWQDTIFLNRGRQYFEDSFIAGHVDFIFGGATAFFERCHLHCWRNGYITAASTPDNERYGFVFSHGRITGQSPDVKTYLGRPWRDFAQVAFIDVEMSDVVRPEGWHNWDRPEREKTARFSEVGTSGTGASSRRATWAKRLTADDGKSMTAASVLRGSDNWNPRQVPSHPSAVKVSELAIPRPPG
jgi:pectinesterase